LIFSAAEDAEAEYAWQKLKTLQNYSLYYIQIYDKNNAII